MSGPDWLAALFLFAPEWGPSWFLPALFAGLFTAWVILSTLPAILLSAGDEHSCLMTAPGQTLVRAGEGLTAIKLAGLGSLLGLVLLAGLLPLGAPMLARTHRVLAPHFGWILWAAILFLALTERPRAAPTAQPVQAHLLYTLAPVLAGVATLLLSGLLGLILYSRSPLPLPVSFLNFIPAMIGLFPVPGLLLNIFTPASPRGSAGMPRPTSTQDDPQGGARRPGRAVFEGYLSATVGGALPGLITALIPALTGAMGALMTRHLVGTRPPRHQLVAQGVTRTLYYGAGLLLIFLPGTPRLRSSSAALLRTFYDPAAAHLWIIVAVIAFSAITAWLILPVCARWMLENIERHGTRPLAGAGLAGILVFVTGTTGWPGLLILLTATGIGLLPVLFQARPIQGIGLVLIPLACALTR